MTSTEPADLTPVEGKLAQAYAETMDFVSRCAQALADGDWDYLADKACQLRNAADALEAVADVAKQATPTPRAAAVRATVQHRGRSYRAVALLHPVQASTLTKTTTSTLLDPFRPASPLVVDTDSQKGGSR